MKTLITVLVVLLLSTPVAAKKAKHCIDAGSGKFVSAEYAKQNPTTTVCRESRRGR